MRKKKIKLILTGLSIAGTLSIGIHSYTSNNKNTLTNKAINEISQFYENNSDIDSDILTQAVKEIDEKMFYGRDISIDEYFLSGYESYLSRDYDNSFEIFNYISKNISSHNKASVRIYTSRILSELYIKNNENEKAFEIIEDTLKQLSSNNYNKYSHSVIDMINTILYAENGTAKAIEFFEYSLNNKKLDIKNLIDIKSNLSILYAANKEYSKSIDISLNVLFLKKNSIDKYHKAKAYSNIGISYLMFENYTSAEKNFNESLNITCDNPEENAIIKIYALSNLFNVYLHQDNLDKILDLSNEIDTYYELIPNKYKDQVNIIRFSIKSTYYLICDKDLNKAEELLKKAESYIYDENLTFLNLKVLNFYYTAKAELLSQQGKYEEFLEIYTQILKDPNITNLSHRLLLKKLNAIYYDNNDIEKFNSSIEELLSLYSNHSKNLYRDYADYVLYKYDYQEELKIQSKKKIERTIIILIIISIIFLIIVGLYIKYYRLMKSNNSDVLTNSYNRRYFEKKYYKLLNSNKKFAIIMIDIDNFKHINDTYGHAFGDKVLKDVVNELNKINILRNNIYRYGGEEFVVILKTNDNNTICNIADNILKNVSKVKYGKKGENVTVSIGIAVRSDEYKDILTHADENLYTSKKNGKNRFTI